MQFSSQDETKIPDSPIAHLSYYVSCLSKICDESQPLCRIDYQNYKSFTSQEQILIHLVADMAPPEKVKAFTLVKQGDILLTGRSNKIIEMEVAVNLLNIQLTEDSLAIPRYNLTLKYQKIMLYTQKWMQEYYYYPMKLLKQNSGSSLRIKKREFYIALFPSITLLISTLIVLIFTSLYYFYGEAIILSIIMLLGFNILLSLWNIYFHGEQNSFLNQYRKFTVFVCYPLIVWATPLINFYEYNQLAQQYLPPYSRFSIILYIHTIFAMIIRISSQEEKNQIQLAYSAAYIVHLLVMFINFNKNPLSKSWLGFYEASESIILSLVNFLFLFIFQLISCPVLIAYESFQIVKRLRYEQLQTEY